MNKNKITKYIYIGLFAALYFSVALVSGIHAVAFFSLANAPALGIMLAITFEIGQAAVLFSLLTNPEQRKKVMTWVQLSIFTLVQVLGNVYSSYKYIVTNSMENLRFFKEPVFIWTDLPDQMCNVIITYLVGGILPISALLLTEMLTSYLYKEEGKQIENVENQNKDNINEQNEDEQCFDNQEENDKEIVEGNEEMGTGSSSGSEEHERVVKATDEDDNKEIKTKQEPHFLNI